MSERITLGRSGLKVSPICYGSWQLSSKYWGGQEEPISRAMRRAFEVGVNFYDTADAYGDGHAEQVMGEALADLPRDRIVVATKVYNHFYPDGRRHPDLSGIGLKVFHHLYAIHKLNHLLLLLLTSEP